MDSSLLSSSRISGVATKRPIRRNEEEEIFVRNLPIWIDLLFGFVRGVGE